MRFNTYHWHGCVLGDPVLERARDELASVSRGLARVSAFEALLRSGNTAAISIALDHYAHAESSSRHGTGNLFAPYAREVLEHARELLRQPALPASASGAEEDGANHASALGAMLNLAEAEDVELITQALERTATPNVQFTGAMAAKTAVEKSTEPNDRLVDTLARILMDESIHMEQRKAALSALSAARSPRAIESIVQATEQSDLRLQASAALILADRYLAMHRALIEQLVASWPENAPYPASEVIEILEEDDGGDGDDEDGDEAGTH